MAGVSFGSAVALLFFLGEPQLEPVILPFQLCRVEILSVFVVEKSWFVSGPSL